MGGVELDFWIHCGLDTELKGVVLILKLAEAIVFEQELIGPASITAEDLGARGVGEVLNIDEDEGVVWVCVVDEERFFLFFITFTLSFSLESDEVIIFIVSVVRLFLVRAHVAEVPDVLYFIFCLKFLKHAPNSLFCLLLGSISDSLTIKVRPDPFNNLLI